MAGQMPPCRSIRVKNNIPTQPNWSCVLSQPDELKASTSTTRSLYQATWPCNVLSAIENNIENSRIPWLLLH
ncbi:unnamed protein product [Clonostachys rosea f. rosea IK726]|uniref:Uncharacterized protein n=3 Tax=Bionectria ochroleuca TaxID=29856 RepID=A0A0B7KHV9_BIOOC|nr:unnamed protein product [Clonostachys rosea f. rosea IK726]CAG9951101.1 unnamed protein product [Clonostachys rosea f. rosea IK726]